MRLPFAILTSAMACLLVGGAALAELSPEQIARIQHEQAEAKAKVLAAHGNKPMSEMSPEERRALDTDERNAALGVLERHGVSDKELTRRSATLNRDEQQQVKDATRKLIEQEKAQAAHKPAPAAKPAGDEPVIERGKPGSSAEQADAAPAPAPAPRPTARSHARTRHARSRRAPHARRHSRRRHHRR